MAPHPRIAVSSPHMSTRSFEELLPHVARHFAVWEIFGEGRQYLWDIESRFKELAPSYDLRYTAHAPISDINIASFNPEVRALALDLVERTIRAAGRMGIDRVTVHPGLRMPMARWDDERLRALTVESAQRLARLGEEVGVTVCLENMAQNWVMTFQEPDWFEGVFGHDDHLVFCFDVAHAHTVGGGVLGRYVKEFTRHCGNVHVSDNDATGDQHWVLGRGSVPIPETVGALERGGYRGNYVIESNSFEEGVESLPAMQKALEAAGG